MIRCVLVAALLSACAAPAELPEDFDPSFAFFVTPE